MTTHIVADDTLGTISRRMWEVQRRLLEGTLEPSFVARNLQSIVEATEVTSAPLVTASPFFADEEVESGYGYPSGYAVKPVEWQAELLTRSFWDHLGIWLDAGETIEYAKDLPDLSSFVPETWMGREIRQWVNWCVVPRPGKIANTGNEAVEKVLDLIGKTRTFHNYRKGALGPKHMRQPERTAVALQMIGKKQKGHFLLIPAHFGLIHRGRSVRRVRAVYAPHEFGLDTFTTACMILSYPERLVQLEQLHIDCPGDEYSPDADGRFGSAPIFGFSDGGVEFSASWVSDAYEDYGSASGFVF
jgi:hypothetical protein